MTAAILDELVRAVGAPAGALDDALELGSLAVVQLVDLIEAESGLVVPARAITRATFATRRALGAMLDALEAGCA